MCDVYDTGFILGLLNPQRCHSVYPQLAKWIPMTLATLSLLKHSKQAAICKISSGKRILCYGNGSKSEKWQDVWSRWWRSLAGTEHCSWLYCFPPTILMFTLFFFPPFTTQSQSWFQPEIQAHTCLTIRHNVILIWVMYNCLTIRVMNLTRLILRKLHNLENTRFNSAAIQNFLLAITRNCWYGATASHNHLKGYQKARFFLLFFFVCLFDCIGSWFEKQNIEEYLSANYWAYLIYL